MNHLRQHWIKYLWLVIFTAALGGLYLKTHPTDAAGVVPIQTGQIGLAVVTGNDSYAPFSYPTAVAIDSLGNMWVADDTLIHKFDSNGNFLFSRGGYGTSSGKFGFIEKLAVDIQGNVYVTDSLRDQNYAPITARVQKFDQNGNFVLKFGTPGSGDGQFDAILGVAVATSGEIYVASCNNHRIQKFDSSGNFISKFGTQGGGDGQFSCPAGVTFDKDGYLYVAEYGNRIQKFDQNGNFISKFGSSGSGNGQFESVIGVAVDSLGNIYTIENDNSRV